MSDSDSEELYLEDDWSEGNDDFLMDEYLDEMAIEGDWFTDSEGGWDSEDEEEDSSEVELDQEYQFINYDYTHLLDDMELELGTLYTKEELKEWVQDALAGALGQQLSDWGLSYSLL